MKTHANDSERSSLHAEAVPVATQEQVARPICKWTALHNPDAAWTEDTLEFGLSTYGKNWERYKHAAKAIIAHLAAVPASDGWQGSREAIVEEVMRALLASEFGAETASVMFESIPDEFPNAEKVRLDFLERIGKARNEAAIAVNICFSRLAAHPAGTAK